MKTRLIALSLVLTALAGFFALPQMLRGGNAELRDPQAAQRSSSASVVSQLEQRVRAQPDSAPALTALASAYLQRSRESGDPAYYPLAESAVQRALMLEPHDVHAIVADGELALARHNFAGALELGERARAQNPDVVATYAVLTDALVELGRYDEAVAAAQELADRRPGFAAYSRISYLRELNGDLDGAMDAMRQAAASAGTPQDEVWARVLLGHLHLNANDTDAAAVEYERASRLLPDDAMSHFGLARLAIARGEFATAEMHLRAAIAARPLSEYVIALGDLLASQGRTAEAEKQYALVRAMQRLFAANGVDTDIELALFDADHDVAPEQTYATARAAYERRSSVYVADVAAWAAYKAGRIDEARAYAAEAIRLGSRDPRLLYHAGVIAQAAGDTAVATVHLRAAIAASAALPPLYRIKARDLLDQLTASARVTDN